MSSLLGWKRRGRGRRIRIRRGVGLRFMAQRTVYATIRLSVLIFASAVRPIVFQTVQKAQRRKTAALQVRL